MSMKRHSVDEIASKLRKAKQLIAGGQSQAQACKELGVSVMTYHRWRKLHPAKDARDLLAAEIGVPVGGSNLGDQKRIEELRIENERLRRIVTDLLLEKAKVEEQIALSLPRRVDRRAPVKRRRGQSVLS
jgi:transposase-like protein